MKFPDNSALYAASQWILAPGMAAGLTRRLREAAALGTRHKRVLDVGCGPESWVARIGLEPVGLDYTHAYMATFARAHPGCGVVGSCDALPFPDAFFDSAWTVGMYHHVPDEMMRTGLREMYRVTKPGGIVVVMDAVLPRQAVTRPIAYALRRLDRGRFMRKERALTSMFQEAFPAIEMMKRFQYTLNGLEGMICCARVKGIER